ncbi:MAG: ABC transporter ATP-binding protein [Solobacterium sp.]|nr:ABC transporter ATP-binding protein [Solobacterium sp.]
MLEVSHLTKRYGKTTACSDLCFTLNEGSITILLGPNGAGKSTVMKAITGFLRHEGTIRINGIENHLPESRRVIGYIPEIPSFYPNLTAAEHLEFLARGYRLKDYKGRAEQLLKRFELYEHRKKFGDELSKGMQQKLNICLGLLTEPSLLLLDEPFIGLDPHAIKELRSVMEEMRAEGKTLLVSTHIIDSIETLWDRVLIMRKGTIEADVSRTDLEKTTASLEDLFFAVTEGSLGE